MGAVEAGLCDPAHALGLVAQTPSARQEGRYLMQHRDVRRPDWVMLGVPIDEHQVCLFASKYLDQAQLERVRDDYDWDDSLITRFSLPRATLSVEMQRYVMIYGPDYATCLRSLLQDWDPDQPQRSIAQEVRELPG